MTLSPTPKVQPKRWTALSSGGLSTFCSSRFKARAPRPPRFIGHKTWISRIGSRPKRAGIRSFTISTIFAAGHEMEIALRVPRPVGHPPLVDAMGVGNDSALGRLAEDLGQPHDRHGGRVNDVGEHLPRT